ncbi:Phosphoglycerate mutase family [Phytophthora palmivora]|uniref:Phosphoglycerate mutase family n=1 Tax=Phytophthora palmivora TaxID=4796 RepID=A0A2P4XUI9_9STRA|nr:Phosphoglycerate mutase family [Phytophthora palmivora]
MPLSATVEIVEGLFAPKASTSDTGLSLFKRFERVSPSWDAFHQQINVMTKCSRNVKVVFFVRHAQGSHNVAEQMYGVGRWEDEFARTDEFLDPDLTPFGVQDTKMKGPPSIKAELKQGMPLIERVVVSPLSRAIQTAQTFFAKDQVPNQPLLCMENCREVLDCYTFDKRRTLSELKQRFPDVDFSRIDDEHDVLWSPTHPETEKEIHERAKNFLLELFDAIPERYVVVVSHVCFIQAVCAVTMGIHFRPDNCEVVPLVVEAT